MPTVLLLVALQLGVVGRQVGRGALAFQTEPQEDLVVGEELAGLQMKQAVVELLPKPILTVQRVMAIQGGTVITERQEL